MEIVPDLNPLLIVYSYHHNNTLKIARKISEILNAEIKTPLEINLDSLSDYTLIGFGSGIYSAKHHESLLSLADKLPPGENKPAFLFSTAALTGESKTRNDHRSLREKLESKGYFIIGDFSCKGFNTNSFLKYLGGMNKGRPNEQDLKDAEAFAHRMKEKVLEPATQNPRTPIE
ncbi:flavodoxin family protein [Methanospirillum lacunae]|uniref:Flavodoxin n=1 Tax=Methanospirillum lacunae TaxID=668570 RepID=A0A2V2NCV7_9EURY|nr:flavodoxin family protein [Methanospirillum lacunae]PWR74187.1 flavodoxin [Methanospirillum lacunae]